MGAWGAIIMSFFGALFAALTLYWQWQVSGAALAVPIPLSFLAALLGFALPAPVGGEIAGFMGALSLWAAAAMAVRREWQAKRTTAQAA